MFSALSLNNFNNFQLLNIFGFLFLTIAPGFLTVLNLSARCESVSGGKLQSLNFWGKLALVVGFSLLELMLVALLGNTLLPLVGIVRPLDKSVLLLELYLLIAVLLSVTWLRIRSVEVTIKRYVFFSTLKDLFLSLIPIVFVALSILGAISLNNGGSDIWTMTMLGGVGAYILFLSFYRKKVDENVILITLFLVSLALLFMTSLRGWYITGHDIQTEYKVFELTKNAGVWSMDFYRDAYNACLSITVLPTIFFNLLKISDPYVYKFFFQLFFALCPGLTYLTSRHWAGRQISLLAGFYFMAFPTFFIDMPFLIRQEIAFLFYGLMLYIIFSSDLSLTLRRWLFMLMGVGVILSHYSTTYTVLLIFVFAAVLRPLFLRLIEKLNGKGAFKDSALIQATEFVGTKPKAKIALWMVAILLVLSFLWTSIITDTGGHVMVVLDETISAVKDGFTENSRSTDAVNLLSFRTPSQQEELQSYIEKVINPIRSAAPAGVYFDASTYEKYKFTALPDEQLPLTALGNLVQRFDINFVTSITLVGRALAKLMEFLAPLGILYLLLRKNRLKYIDDEFYLLSFFALLSVFLIIVIPVLSTEYGIFRALQQSMFILALPMVLGSVWLGVWIRGVGNSIRKLWFKVWGIRMPGISAATTGRALPVVFAFLFFLYSTSFILQLFGGNPALLYLNNTGRYYDNYLIKAPEVSAVEWLSTVTSGNSEEANGVTLQIQTDRFSQKKLASLSSLDAYNDIFPGVVRKDSYVFLGQATVKKQRATLVYGGDQITYTYPVQFLDENKNLIYNNGSAKIYR